MAFMLMVVAFILAVLVWMLDDRLTHIVNQLRVLNGEKQPVKQRPAERRGEP